jgi:hypothetical protein
MIASSSHTNNDTTTIQQLQIHLLCHVFSCGISSLERKWKILSEGTPLEIMDLRDGHTM